MLWNYRVLKCDFKNESVYAIHEVYYDDEGNPDGWTANPSWPQGETKKELYTDAASYILALSKPVLVVGDDDKLMVLPMEADSTGGDDV